MIWKSYEMVLLLDKRIINTDVDRNPVHGWKCINNFSVMNCRFLSKYYELISLGKLETLFHTANELGKITDNCFLGVIQAVNHFIND